ncbi:MAG: SDR family oxidoreductase [Melioribacteraceae bacterium]|nr:SDR family oxidoreductase [Melioribacteraceae bacterium]
MKILFIGGTGNISTSVSKLCLSKGSDLYLLNRGTRKVDLIGPEYLKCDISDSFALNNVLKDHKWDVVVNWIAFTEQDVERDINLFRGRTKQYVFISSASAYQKPPSHPVITESTPLYNPYWQYSRDKIACEEKLNRAYREENFPITIVRPSLTYSNVIPVAIGGWTEYTIIDRMKKGEKVIVHGDGTSLWIVTHSDDFAVGFTGLLGHQQAIGHAFHITSDEILTWNQIYEAVAEAAGVTANIIHIPSDFIASQEERFTGSLIGDKAASVMFDNSKIKTFVPEYKAVIPFKVGVKRALEWFESDPDRMIISEDTNAMMDRIIESYDRK